MPGEDLESDDEYLNPVVIDDDGEGSVATDEASSPPGFQTKEANEKKKRKRNETSTNLVASRHTADDVGVDVHTASKSRRTKTKKEKSPRQVVLETSRGIGRREVDIQAAFLWTCFSHSRKMAGDQLEDVEKFTADNFYDGVGAAGQSPSRTIAEFIKGGISKKRLKKWKVYGSPMVIVVCLSARRAVAILKELSTLNVRCAKLFPKNMNVEGQVSMLQSTSFGIACGTPNWLLKLFETETDGAAAGGGTSTSRALSLARTELVVIDCHEDHKRFTVCTLNDTAPDLMQFIRVAVVPEMEKRDSLKFAMY